MIQDTEKDKITIENAGQQTKLIVTASGDGMPNTSNPWLFKFTSGNVGVAGKKITLPHYMMMFI